MKNNNNININETEPSYVFCNIQYQRCLRDKNEIKERIFKKEYLDHNYYLLLQTIQIVSNKLYVNWIDVLPFDMITYKESQLYIDTKIKFQNNNNSEWNPCTETIFNESVNNKLKGLPICDIYDTIANEFYYNILDTKWIIYDLILQTENQDLVPLILCLSYILDISGCTNNIEWHMLNSDEKKVSNCNGKNF